MKSLLTTALIVGLLCSLPSPAKESDDSPRSVTIQTTSHLIRPSVLEAREPSSEAQRASRYSAPSKDCQVLAVLRNLARGFTGGLAASLLLTLAFICPGCKAKRSL